MTNSNASTSSSVSPVGIIAVLLGIAAMVILPFTDGFHPIALILAIAAVIVAILGVVIGRRESATPWSAYIGLALGVLSVILVIVFAAA